ncbi:hypothetical protein DFJ73DRAFT_129880 [Zopfochytrium polystomum]|nr:hypothetical protein DFJ73DRAFT_129880 [Zopfochytrium polystomum]
MALPPQSRDTMLFPPPETLSGQQASPAFASTETSSGEPSPVPSFIVPAAAASDKPDGSENLDGSASTKPQDGGGGGGNSGSGGGAAFALSQSYAKQTAAPGNIYGAVYSGIPVYEMLCKNVAVMRRRADSYLNATQILKVAGVEKGKRTKILEREIAAGDHEKVQGGYGKYQGTWIPFHRGVELARIYGVEKLIKPLFDFELPPPGRVDTTPTKEQLALVNKEAKRAAAASEHAKRKEIAFGNAGPQAGEPARNKRPKRGMDTKLPGRGESAMSDTSSVINDDEEESPPWSPKHSTKKRIRLAEDSYSNGLIPSTPQRPQSFGMLPVQQQRAGLMSMFLNDDPNYVPDFLKTDTGSGDPGFDVDMIIDEMGHTSIHWAVALARLKVLRILIAKGANIRKTNYSGESALIRSVLIPNNYDCHTFKIVLSFLSDIISLPDNKNRTVLHHIALTAGIKGRVQSARYYLECLFDHMAGIGSDFASLIDIKDRNGDTALNVAARIGNRSIVEMLLDAGANPEIENMAGLKPPDFGMEDVWQNYASVVASNQLSQSGELSLGRSAGSSRVVFPNIRTPSDGTAATDGVSAITKRGRELAETMQRMVAEMNGTYTLELQTKQDQLIDTQLQLREITRELAEVRKQNQALRLKNSRLPDLTIKIRNLERAMRDEISRGLERERAARELNLMMGGNVPWSAAADKAGLMGEVAVVAEGDNGGSGFGPPGAVNDAGTAREASERPHPTTAEASEVEELRRRVRILESHLDAKFSDEKALREEIVALKAQHAEFSGSRKSLAPGTSTPGVSTPGASAGSVTAPPVEQERIIGRQELLCRKIIAACCNVSLDSVDDLLDPLLAAVESDDVDLDLGSVSDFMSKAVNMP